jgi:hypothetical protein
LKNQQKELFQFIRDQEAKKIGIRQKPMKINPTFKTYYYGKDSFESLKLIKGNYATFRLVDSAESKSEIISLQKRV